MYINGEISGPEGNNFLNTVMEPDVANIKVRSKAANWIGRKEEQGTHLASSNIIWSFLSLIFYKRLEYRKEKFRKTCCDSFSHNAPTIFRVQGELEEIRWNEELECTHDSRSSSHVQVDRF